MTLRLEQSGAIVLVEQQKGRRMTVSPIGQGLQPLAGTSDTSSVTWQQRLQEAMGPVAQLFNESPQQLMQQLQSGSTSLSALAQSQGVSQSSLLAAIQQGLQQGGGPASSMSATQLANLSSTIANRVHHGHHHHHHGGGGGGGGVSGVSATNGASSTSDLTAILGADPDGDADQSSTGIAAATSSPTSTLAPATTAQQVDLAQVLFSLQATQPA